MALNVSKEEKTITLESGASLPVAVVTLDGRIESTTIQTFQEPLEALRNSGPHNVILDFSGVVYISSTGLGGLFKYSEAFGEKGGGLCLVKVPDEAHNVIHMLGVDAVVSLFDTVDEAAAHLGSGVVAEKVELTEQQRLAEVRSQAIAGQGEKAAKTGNYTVLLAVPGNNIFSSIIENKLKAKDIEVLVASDVEEAWQKSKENDVDLVVVDFLMPNHEELSKKLKTKIDTGAISLLLLYEEGVRPTNAKTVQVMSNEYIVEPFDLDKLVELINSELERHRVESAYLDHEVHLRFPTQSDFAADTGNMFKEIIGQTKFIEDEKTMLAISSACREAIDNACRHGNKWDENKFIDLFYILDNDKLTISVKDQGEGFNWKNFLENAQNSKANELAKKRDFENLGGLGIALMMRCVDMISYNDKGNIITLIKEKPALN